MSAIVVPGEIAPEVPEAWPIAHGWLYSWVDTSTPGYRSVELTSGTYTATSGHLRWDLFVDEINDRLQTAPEVWDLVIDGTGRINGGGDVTNVTWPERLGWLFGFGVEAGYSHTAVTSLLSPFVPPGGIPCLGVSWEAVDLERDRELVLDRARSQQGYVFGGARVWRVRATMTRWALDALLTGWCLRGKLTAMCGNVTAIGPVEPGGAITGHVLGLESVAWLDSGSTQSTALATILLATVTT